MFRASIARCRESWEKHNSQFPLNNRQHDIWKYTCYNRASSAILEFRRTQEPKRSREKTKKQWQSYNSLFASVQTSDGVGIHRHDAFICVAYTRERGGRKNLTHSGITVLSSAFFTASAFPRISPVTGIRFWQEHIPFLVFLLVLLWSHESNRKCIF